MKEAAKRCDQCGREMEKAHRVYKGEAYCTTCYYREFKRAICPKCGVLSRLHRKVSGAVCRKCEYKDVPCVRCGRVGRAISKITEYGPVCGSCAKYFLPMQPCEACGKLEQALSRDSRSGTDLRLCKQCRDKFDGTCELCGVRRRVFKYGTKLLCSRCAIDGMVTCPECGKEMAAGAGKKCRECKESARLRKRVALCLPVFHRNDVAVLFQEYADWLERRVGVAKASLTINRYLEYFVRLENIPEGELTPESLLGEFGKLGLRRPLLPTRFLEEEKGLVVSAEAKDLAANLLCIQKYRDAFEAGSDGWLLMNAFADMLAAKFMKKQLKVRSARLALGCVLAALAKTNQIN